LLPIAPLIIDLIFSCKIISSRSLLGEVVIKIPTVPFPTRAAGRPRTLGGEQVLPICEQLHGAPVAKPAEILSVFLMSGCILTRFSRVRLL
jgi:hypothetical protein